MPEDPRGSWERVCHHAWRPSGARMVGWGIYHHPWGPVGVHCCAWGPTMGRQWWSASVLGATPGVTGLSPPRCLGSLRALLAGVHCSTMGARDGWRVGVCCGEQGPARGHQQGYTAVSCVSLGLAARGPLPCPWARRRSLPGVRCHTQEPCGSCWQGSIGEAGGLPGLAGGSTAMPGGPPQVTSGCPPLRLGVHSVLLGGFVQGPAGGRVMGPLLRHPLPALSLVLCTNSQSQLAQRPFPSTYM